MRIVRILVAILAALWSFGCLLKVPGSIAMLGQSNLATSRLLGSVVGLIVGAGISVLLFRSAFKHAGGVSSSPGA